MIAVISSSLNSDSNSRLLALEAKHALEERGQPVRFIDLREHPMPLCDGGAASLDSHVMQVGKILREADAFIVATAIYNYNANAALKNLIELTGDAWENKVAAFLCAAGGLSSYMSIMSLANSLMLDFRTVIVPRFIYATGKAFHHGEIIDIDVKRRIADLVESTVQLSTRAKAA